MKPLPELVGFICALSASVLLSELHLRVSRITGLTLAICATIRVLSDIGTVPIAPLAKLLLVIAGSLAVCITDHSPRLYQMLLFVNIAVMCVPSIYHKRYSTAALLACLSVQVPVDVYDEHSRYFLLAKATVFLQYYLISTPFQNKRCIGLLLILPMFVPLLRARPVRDACIYRIIAMLVGILWPDVWSRSVPPPYSPFQLTKEAGGDWVQMEDTLARVFDNPHPLLHTAMYGFNAYMLYRARQG